MCIIFEVQPDTTIDEIAFETACDNNPDGYGIVIPDGNGRCTVLKGLEYKPSDLHKIIHEVDDVPVMIHLRYTTAGVTSRRNLHPFPILEYATDGVDLWMAHNGTLSKWKHSSSSPMDWESDTRHFVRGFVRPLFKRLIKGMSSEEILKDPFVLALLEDQLSAASVLSFMDGYGNSLQCNPLGNGGKYDKGLYYSNEYSFDPTHRLPYSSNRGGSTYQGKYLEDYTEQEWQRWWDGRAGGTTERTNNVNDTGWRQASDKHAEDSKQESFCSTYGCDDDDVFQITDDTLEWMAEEDTENLLRLVKELLARTYEAERSLASLEVKKDKAEKKIAELKKELENARTTA